MVTNMQLDVSIDDGELTEEAIKEISQFVQELLDRLHDTYNCRFTAKLVANNGRKEQYKRKPGDSRRQRCPNCGHSFAMSKYRRAALYKNGVSDFRCGYCNSRIYVTKHIENKKEVLDISLSKPSAIIK